MLRWLTPVAGREAGAGGGSDAGRRGVRGAGVGRRAGPRRCLGKPELYQKILGRYLKQRAATGNEIRTALEAGELEAGARTAHTLISTASMIGAPALAALARDLHDTIDGLAPEHWPRAAGARRLRAVGDRRRRDRVHAKRHVP